MPQRCSSSSTTALALTTSGVVLPRQVMLSDTHEYRSLISELQNSFSDGSDGAWKYLEGRGFRNSSCIGRSEQTDWTTSYVSNNFCSIDWFPVSVIRKAKALCTVERGSLRPKTYAHLHRALAFLHNYWGDAFTTVLEELRLNNGYVSSCASTCNIYTVPALMPKRDVVLSVVKHHRHNTRFNKHTALDDHCFHVSLSN